ncbi:MAG: hypothetical protein ACHQT8_05840, partial [Chlamydiales bacterium]
PCDGCLFFLAKIRKIFCDCLPKCETAYEREESSLPKLRRTRVSFGANEELCRTKPSVQCMVA